MTRDDALALMNKGLSVKKSNCDTFYRKEDGKIICHLEDGNIVTTDNLFISPGKHESDDNWEVAAITNCKTFTGYPRTFGIEEMLDSVENDLRVSRMKFNDTNHFCFKIYSKDISFKAHANVLIEKKMIPFIGEMIGNDVTVWRPTIEDLKAKDWFVVV